jgi:TPP-dependent pyruvate/acetoin dehydrogenase alpha subunit
MAQLAILKKGVASEAQLDELARDVEEEIEGWVKFAKESDDPQPEKATANVYVGWEVQTR